MRALFTKNLEKHARTLRRLPPESNNLQLFRARWTRRSLLRLQYQRIDLGNRHSLAHRLGVSETGFADDKNVVELGLRHYRVWKARKLHQRYGPKVCVFRYDNVVVPF